MVLNGDGVSVVSHDLADNHEDDRLTLQAALGVQLSDHFAQAKRNLVVEDLDTYWVISELSSLMERKMGRGLPDDVLVSAAGGVQEMVHMTTLMAGRMLSVVALFPSHEAGRRKEAALREKWLPLYKQSLVQTMLLGDLVGEGPDFILEDLFDDVYYLRLANEAHAQEVAAAGLKRVDLPIESTDASLVERARVAFEAHGIPYDGRAVVRLIRRDLRRTEKWDKMAGVKKGQAKKLMDRLSGIFSQSDQ
jgi:hypothetical protein